MRQRPLPVDRTDSPVRAWLLGGGSAISFLCLTLGAVMLMWVVGVQQSSSPLKLLIVLPGAVVALLLLARGVAYFVFRPLVQLIVLLLTRFGKPQADYPCPVCGYDTRATPNRCPECGTPLQWGLWTRPSGRQRYHARARQ